MPDGPTWQILIESQFGAAGVQAAEAALAQLAEQQRAMSAEAASFGTVTPLTTASAVEQRREILALTQQQLRLEEQGDAEGAAALDQQIASARLSLQIQGQAQVAQQTANAAAGEMVAIKRQQAAAQAVAGEEAAAWAEREAEIRRQTNFQEREAQDNLLAQIELRAAAEERSLGFRQMEAQQMAAFRAQQDAALDAEVNLALATEKSVAAKVAMAEAQARLNARIAEEAEARQIELETMEAQEALNDELVAQELERLRISEEQEASGLRLRGIGLEGRAAGMLFGGEIGFAVFAAVELVNVFERLQAAAKKANDEIGKIGGTAEQSKSKLQELEDVSKHLPDGANQFKAALDEIDKSLDSEEKSINRQAQAVDKIREAEERLAIAKIKSDSSLSPEAKDAAIAKTQGDYDDKAAQDKRTQDEKLIDIQRRKIDAAQVEAANAYIAQQAAKASLEAEIEKLAATRAAIAAAKLEAQRAPGVDDHSQLRQGLRYAGAAGTAIAFGESPSEQVAYEEQQDVEKKALVDQVKALGEQLKSEEAKGKKLADAKKKADEAAIALKEKATETESTAGGEISDLKSDIDTSAAVQGINKETAVVNAKSAADKTDLSKRIANLEAQMQEQKLIADSNAETSRKIKEEITKSHTTAEHESKSGKITGGKTTTTEHEKTVTEKTPDFTAAERDAAAAKALELEKEIIDLKNQGDPEQAARLKKAADEEAATRQTIRDSKDGKAAGNSELQSQISDLFPEISKLALSGTFKDNRDLADLLSKIETAVAAKDTASEQTLLPRILTVVEKLASSPTQGNEAKALEARVNRLESIVHNTQP